MNKIIVRRCIVLAILLAVGSLQGCSALQRAGSCSSCGAVGGKDAEPEPLEIKRPPADLEGAPPGGRAQQAPARDDRYLDGHEYPWSQSLDDCMAAGGTRTQCFASLPPDILEQFEAWEGERAAQRRRQFQQRARQPSFGAESINSTTRD